MTQIIQTSINPDSNPALVYIASMPSPKSRRSQAQVIRQLAAWLGGDAESVPWHALRYQHTSALRTRAMESYAPATARKYIAALRGVLKHAWRLGLMDGDTYQRAVDLDPIEGTTLPSGRDLSQGEINALIHACMEDPSPAGVRDAAIISILYMCLARRASVVELTLQDYDPQSGRLVLHGKRSKDNAVFLTGGALAAMEDWLRLRGMDPGPIFCPVSQLGDIQRTGEAMSDQAIYNLCAKRGAQAGVENFSPHDFKRTAVGDLLERGVDLLTASGMAAHDDPKTTKRYDRRGEQVRREAAQKLHVPYKARTINPG